MKIYLDILLITNAIVTLIYLHCIGRIIHKKISVKRELICCTVGGTGALIAIPESENFFEALLITAAKLGVITLIVIIGFSPDSLSEYIKDIFLYILMEVVLGGCCFLLINITHRKILYMKNYVVYFDVSLLEIAVGCAMAYIAVSIYERVQRRKTDSGVKYRASYSLGKYEISMPAICDSGNCLCDTFTGESVVIFCCDELYEHFNLDRPEQMAFYGFRAVPYKTINGMGIINVTSKGSVTITGKDRQKTVRCCVGILPSDNGAKAIFNPILLT